jgi:hypothetical protein
MRDLSSVNRTGIASTLTRPVYLVEFLFATPLRLSSRETITYAGNTFTAATLQVDIAGSSIKLLNASLAYTSTFKVGADGVRCSIWVVYGDGTFTRGDADMVFNGEVGAVGISEQIVIRLRDAPPKQVPRLQVAPPAFNNLPPDGLEIRTPTGLFRLERG